MASLAKAREVYGAKIKRQSAAPPPYSTDRTGLKIQETPPELCHLTGDALATPFPPIALGGYMRYYRAHPEHLESFGTEFWGQERAKFEIEVKESLREAKKRRRASSASLLLGPLLSHMPKPSPSNETPPKSHLFHIRSSSSPESTPFPDSPNSPPPIPPRSKRRHLLSIIPEGSRETMRSENRESISLPNTPRKSRVISYPSAIPTPTKTSLNTSVLTLSLPVSPPERSSSLAKSDPTQTPRSVPLSPGGSLRRKKRRVLRTPSVENDFARSARELLGFGRKEIGAGSISRQNSSGSDVTTTEEDSSLSPTASVSTALTSLLDTSSLPPSPSSPTGLGEKDRLSPNDNQELPKPTAVGSGVVVSTTPLRCSFELNSKSSCSTTASDQSSDSDAASSPTVSTPPMSFSGGGLLDDVDLRRFVVLELDDDDDGNRDSWASYVTAKSCLEPSLPIVVEADEGSSEPDTLKTQSAVVAAQA
ncbi:hypothetical protein NP233_g10040 [Leucocoprinus birnbaumii]|uniref:Uncharacterized protein n=1 Tax=Leucocoprinus birnbaumii TaxID=56174 RepID=A0AAD5VJA2_9AGAR|nr:hypothetical protein NP233_g10040 [Leucocoprinus birnbaumii]